MMLILNRKEDERIFIDGGIVITVLGWDRRHGGFRIGIDAPKSVRIRREEVHEREWPAGRDE